MERSFLRTAPLLGVLVAAFSPSAVGARDEQPPAPLPAKEERVLLLQTVGLLSASQVYQAYLNIGFLADGKANSTYEEKDVRQIMESVSNLLSATDKQLEKVGRLEISRADREGLERVRKLSALVRQQGEELQAFWKTGDKERGAKYEKLRQEAWEGISALLNLEKK